MTGQGGTPEPRSRELRPGRAAPPALLHTSIAEVEDGAVDWLWPGRLPFGCLVILDGDPGLGKSTLTADVAARVTTGGPMPDDPPGARRPPYGVLMLSAEDSLSATVKPRLLEAGADVTRVLAASEVVDAAGGGTVMLPDHLPLIEGLVFRQNVALLVIDPLVAFLSPDVQYINDQSVRRALGLMARMAERTGCCVLMVRHPAKGGGRAIHRGGGSVGITGAARVALYLAEHPLDPERRVLAVAKSNLAAPARSLVLRLQPGEAVPSVRWEATTHLSADHLAGWEGEKVAEKDAVREAAVLIRRLIGHGGASKRQVRDAARAAEITVAALRGAAWHLGVVREPSRFDPGGEEWSLPLERRL